MSKVPEHYVPSSLSKNHKRKLPNELRKSRKAYKRKILYA